MTEQKVSTESPARGPGLEALRGVAPHQRKDGPREHVHAGPEAAGQEAPPGGGSGPPAARVPVSAPSSAALASSLAALGEVERVSWWRRLLRLGPSKVVLEAAARQAKLRTPFADTLTITVASPKGSAGKTPVTRGLAAAFGHSRGGGVVAIDMNELRGTLGQRSVTGHDGHIGKLVEAADYLLGHHASTVEIERCMNRQDSFEWVLASDPGTTQPMSVDDWQKIHTILKRFYPLLVVDTGNAELSSSWQAATQSADLLVVPMKWRADHVLPAAKMLEGMAQRGERIGGRTIIVGTNGAGEANPLARSEAMQYFSGLPIHEIPVDEALNQQVIRWDALQPATKIAFENLGAALTDLAQGARP